MDALALGFIVRNSRFTFQKSETLAHHDAHLALAVPDVATIANSCISGGHPWEEAPALFGTGRGFTRDTGGNRVEVVQELDSTLDHQLGQ